MGLSLVRARTSRAAAALTRHPTSVVDPIKDAVRIADRSRTTAAARIVAQVAAQIVAQVAAQIVAQVTVRIAAQIAAHAVAQIVAQIADADRIDLWVAAAAGRTRFAPSERRSWASRWAPTSS